MPTAKEFTILMKDRPGTLGKVCQALADRGVNILAFQSFTARAGESQVHLIADNPTITKSVLESQGLAITEADVVQLKLPHRAGELARAASRLGEANININYTYLGVEPETNAPLVFFGVAEVGQAVSILERAAAAAGT
jgi:hypothetical protein